MRRFSPVLIAASVLLPLAAGSAQAATASTTFQVNATVIPSCLVTGALLNFGGSIDPLTASVPVDASTTLSVQCTNTTSYSVALSAGANAGGASNFSTRAMKSGSNTLGYQLYLDSGRATVWGDGTNSSSPVAGTGTGGSQTLTIYGRLPSLTNAVPGSYTDTVTVTVSY